VEFIDCVGDFNLDDFYFVGSHFTESIEYYDKFDNYTGSFGSNASINFEDDQTFTINVILKCDTLISILPVCDSSNYESGYNELVLEGTYTFEQRIGIRNYSCGFIKPTTCQTNTIRGECNLNILDSEDSLFDENTVVCDIYVECGVVTTIYWLDINIPINGGDRLFMQILYEEFD
jgi:hypothetical protein